MRKKTIHLLTTLVCLSLFFTASTEATAEESGQVLTIKNKVYVSREGSRRTAAARMPIMLKDAVETDRKSRTKLFFNDDSILNLGELSRLEVEEYLFNQGENRSKSIYRLIDGTLKVVVGRSDLEIHTPTIVAAARGTKFIVKVEQTDGEINTHIYVLEGNVIMSHINPSIKGTSNIGAGQKSSAGQSSAPTRPIRFKPDDLKIVNMETLVPGDIGITRNAPLPKLVRLRALNIIRQTLPKRILINQPVLQAPMNLPPTPIDIDVRFP